MASAKGLSAKQWRKKNAAKKKNGNGNGKKKGINPPGLRGIKQGVAQAPKKAFGDTPSGSTDPRVFNAFMPQHLALPRGVGDYITVRTTQQLKSPRAFILFGPQAQIFGSGVGSELAWTAGFAVSESQAGGVGVPINQGSNSSFNRYESVLGSGFDGMKFTPSAFTIQVMNPNALQTTAGIVYIGRAKQVLDFRDSSETWAAKANELISYTAPRLCSAAKLALNGVTVDAIPYNMSSLADFRPKENGPTGATAYTKDVPYFDGFAQIFVYNPNNVELEYLVCCEWRARFDPLNPAHASHVHHPVTSDKVWDAHIQRMSREGNGVKDIAQQVAHSGMP